MRTGALIGLGFGLLWWLVGAGALGGAIGTVVQAAGALLFAAAAVGLFKRPPRETRGSPRWGFYVAAVVAEIVAIMLVQRWLMVRGLGDLLLPAVGVIVGLHFIGLWAAFRRRRFLALAAALVAINLAALLVPLPASGRLALSGFGSAAALLVTALLR